ncbi:MAG: hypothetical protein J6T98_05695 [Salinivirgaceae bacterium]|nr:hypothetical protein [Salinivirgaceae bacterium]
MKMRNAKLLLLFGVLLLATIAVFLRNGKSTIGRSEGRFNVEDTASVTSVIISNMHGESVELERVQHQWLVDGQTTARTDLIPVLLKVLHDIDKSKAVAKKAADGIASAMKTDGFHIVVKNRRKAIVSYNLLFGENNVCIAMIDGSKHPFEVEVPGYPQIITILKLSSAADWKSRAVFAANSDRIEQIVFNSESHPDRSFIMKRNGRQMEVYSYPLGLKISNIDNEKVDRFVAQFQRKDYSSQVQQPQLSIDSITASRPIFTLSITTTDGREQWCRAFERRLTGNSPDPDNFYMLLSNGDFVQARYYDFDPVIKSLKYFESGEK